MTPINVAIAGVGNCASSLVQGIAHYSNGGANEAIGLSHWDLGGWRPRDLKIVAAFDVDRRKVGQDVAKAIFAEPNCTAKFHENVPLTGALVEMGAVLDGVAPHMLDAPEARSFRVADAPQPTLDLVVERLKRADAHVLMNYLPVGSQKATEFYAEAALKAGVAFVNNIPVFIASNPEWAKRFADAGVPLIGDDIKAQLGATIVHRTLTELFARRGVRLNRTYQLNTGGNTDFLNMLARDRLESKKKSKTEAVQSATDRRLEDDNIHVGPSDYVAWQNDNKVCFLRMEGELFGGVPMNLELRLSVEDSPNSAGVAIDLVRCAALARARGIGGVIEAPSATFCKHPPVQIEDGEAHAALEAFIAGPQDAPTRH
ncbi:inositol-3-phosphate synthase [Sandaracinobacter sp.]|uniref:inositol-3-phosphate synthase n=1 Tax=Sandaracinobacter sp. TaxID=2487581 RepID=UPI0035AE8DE9